ncbi:hypothetical protein QBC46DRAFT_121922 [Diplogelasinospora grovesii]|uniref:Uncharacterized protein n=1 Tax=Diplogelasinospora grovesii TaxID=303347 RepID=A0AAN6N7J9_9PEZI|nr:hypothetical protein QBC46DRAFT_121922 [Diplogelasinospora grovesii]
METPTNAQYERDLRSASKERKRSKDSATKWRRGSRPSGGVQSNWITGELISGSDAKTRPKKRKSETGFSTKQPGNQVKLRATYDGHHYGRLVTTLYAQQEATDKTNLRSSVGDLLSPSPTPTPPGRTRRSSVSDNFLYSFDRVDSPGQPVALEYFVKTTGRETEKLVEKEYEVLDSQGEALKGRKARRILRQKAATDIDAAHHEFEEDDDGFELV